MIGRRSIRAGSPRTRRAGIVIDVDIDTIVVEGATPGEAAELGDGLRVELERELAAVEPGSNRFDGRSQSLLRTTDVLRGARPAETGAAIARSISAALSNDPARPDFAPTNAQTPGSAARANGPNRP